MCWSCVRGEMDEAGLTEVVVTDDMVRIAQLIEAFYQLPGCSVGGPLHITVEDNNVTDHNLEFCRRTMLDTDDHWSNANRSPARDELGVTILDRLQALSEVERSVTCAMHHGDRYVPPGTTRRFTYPAVIRLVDEDDGGIVIEGEF